MLAHTFRTLAHGLRGLLVVAAVACATASPTAPDNQAAEVEGQWDARITGIQQRSGAPQTDDARLTLRQSGSTVTGTITYSGSPTPASLSGSVSNRTFTFTAAQPLSPACSARVEARVAVSAQGNEMSGSYRAVTCEDTVIGTLTATRR